MLRICAADEQEGGGGGAAMVMVFQPFKKAGGLSLGAELKTNWQMIAGVDTWSRVCDNSKSQVESLATKQCVSSRRLDCVESH